VEVCRGTITQCRFGPGDHFGEIALLRDINRTATVVALSDVRLAILGTTEFLDALASSEAAYGIAWRTTTEMIESHHAPTPT
jgi:CRP-like cAMP-binding protein